MQSALAGRLSPTVIGHASDNPCQLNRSMQHFAGGRLQSGERGTFWSMPWVVYTALHHATLSMNSTQTQAGNGRSFTQRMSPPHHIVIFRRAHAPHQYTPLRINHHHLHGASTRRLLLVWLLQRDHLDLMPESRNLVSDLVR